MQLHHAIFIPNGNYEESQKTIYGKMFVDKDKRFTPNSYGIYVHKTFKTNATKEVDFLAFMNASRSAFLSSNSPHSQASKKYNLNNLPNTFKLSFTKDKTITYWGSFGQSVGNGEGNAFQLNSTKSFAYLM